jgi:hypothetical protein
MNQTIEEEIRDIHKLDNKSNNQVSNKRIEFKNDIDNRDNEDYK